MFHLRYVVTYLDVSQCTQSMLTWNSKGNYFKNTAGGLNIHLETKRSRAARGGVGNVKCSGNYAVALKPLMEAKKQGFHDNLFLELETYAVNGSLENAILQEMSAANVFFVLKTGEIVTPSLDRGTILPGVTRDSVITIVEDFKDDLKAAMKESTGQENISVSSRDLTVGELQDAMEGKLLYISAFYVHTDVF
jgi:branched-chain amino acid aminotransferase